jgi:hypothetical protein
MPTLNDAVNTIRAGNREQGRQMLEEILETDEGNEDVWLWLSSVVDSDEDREICLENVLALNPDNVVAQKGLEALRSGTFNVQGTLEEAIEEGQEQSPGESTFLDQFNLAGEEAESADWVDELKTPADKKAAASQTKKSAKPAKPVNVRLILLIGLGLVVVLALASAAIYNILSGDSNPPTPQQQPAQSTSVAPTAETTPTPVPPTDTPTPTPTREIKLPTSKPTEPPTPTSTPVVSPTVPVGK